MFKHILVPVDGSEHAKRAVEVASDLAKQTGAKLTLLHVLTHVGGYNVPNELQSYAKIEHIRVTEKELIESVGQEVLATAMQLAHDNGASGCKTQLENGDPASQIATAARDGDADLIVMGRRGLGDLGGLLLGSVSHKVAQAVDCSCLTVK